MLTSTLLLSTLLIRNINFRHIIVFSSLTLFFYLNFIINTSINLIIHDKLFSLDIISINLILLSLWVFIIIILLRYRQIIKPTKKYIFLIISTSLTIILIICFSINNYLIFYILFEATLIPTTFLILLWGYQPERLIARFFLILYIISRSLPLLLIMVNNNLLNFSTSLFNFVIPYSTTYTQFFLNFFFILAFIIKLPLFLLHIWLPKAHVEAPLAGSIVLAAILLKLGAFGIIRLRYLLPFILHKNLKFFRLISLIGAIYTRFICLRQTDLKALIAYSSVSHMGVTISSMCAFDKTSWDASSLILCAHAFSSSLLFSLAYHSYELSNSRRLILTKGLIKLLPILRIFWFIAAIIRLGAPPFINLPAEILIAKSVIINNFLTILIFSIILFTSSIYRLILFTSTSHGSVINFSKKTSIIKYTQISAYFIHVLPPIFFIILIKSFIN